METLLIFAQEQVALVIAFIAMIVLFIRHESAKGGAKLSCPQVVQAINSGESVVLDVREAKDFEQGHIANAIHIPHSKVSGQLQRLSKYRQKQIIVADNVGQHSGAVVKALAAAEFQSVRLGGGIAEWKQNNLPLVK